MTKETFYNYLKYSNVQIAFNLNPFTWGFNFIKEVEPEIGFWHVTVKALMLRFTVMFDNGTW